MLTVNYDKLALRRGDRLLDFGCGGGRHTYEALLRGAQVVSCDKSLEELEIVAATAPTFLPKSQGSKEGTKHDTRRLQPRWFSPCPSQGSREGTKPDTGGEFANESVGAWCVPIQANGYGLPFADHSFDKIIAAEVLEHIEDDQRVLAELWRVIKPGGVLAVTVPSWFPEHVCWMLSSEYHAPAAEDGHLRIYSRRTLKARLRAANFEPLGSHRAHALHSPYWWLRCLVGVRKERDSNALVRLYHKLLEWEIMKSPLLLRIVNKLLNPLLGKSLVIYATALPAPPASAKIAPKKEGARVV